MQIITGYSEILLMGMSGNEKIYNKLQKIIAQVKRMQTLIQKLNMTTRYKTKAHDNKTKIIDLKHSTERRSDKRFMPHRHVIITFKSNFSMEGQLIDISKNGLSFWCDKSNSQKDKLFKLNINIAEIKFSLDNIPYIIMSDLESTDDDLLSTGKKKRCRVKFGELMQEQIDQIEYFIQNHTTAKAG